MLLEDPRIYGARQWLAKAAEDLGLAELLVRDTAFPGSALFHCQQAAEKALKAFLFWHNTPFRKTHDLIELGGQCAALEPGLASILEQAAPLNDYAWKFRYPGEPEEPAVEEAEDALAVAREVYQAVLARLPAETHPSPERR